jgi:hypothetical protein
MDKSVTFFHSKIFNFFFHFSKKKMFLFFPQINQLLWSSTWLSVFHRRGLLLFSHCFLCSLSLSLSPSLSKSLTHSLLSQGISYFISHRFISSSFSLVFYLCLDLIYFVLSFRKNKVVSNGLTAEGKQRFATNINVYNFHITYAQYICL